jgi:hypothetical protein
LIPTARHVRVLAVAAILAIASACSQVSAPVTKDTYMLDRVNGNPLPAVLDRSSHRTLEVLAGTLEIRSDGRARASHSMRITDADAAPVETAEETAGTWRREGDYVVITFDDGFVHTFEAVAAGERLRTSAMRCTRDCAMATSILHIFEYQMVVFINTPAGG